MTISKYAFGTKVSFKFELDGEREQVTGTITMGHNQNYRVDYDTLVVAPKARWMTVTEQWLDKNVTVVKGE